MQERLSGTYDVLAIGHDTRKNLLENKDNLLPYEIVISSDTGDLLYKDEQGNLSGFFGATGDINEQIKIQVDSNTASISELKDKSNIVDTFIGDISSKVEGKLDKGSFTGTADDLAKEADMWKQPSKKLEDLGIYDLNAILEEGTYECHDGRSNVTNFPPALSSLSGTAFSLRVKKVETYIIQEFITHTGSMIFTRGGSIHGTFNAWLEVFSEGNSPISKNQNGWCRLANGMIMQWGSLIPPNTNIVTMPISFSSSSSFAVSSTANSVIPISNTPGTVSVLFSINSPNSFTLDANAGYSDKGMLHWTAIGY